MVLDRAQLRGDTIVLIDSRRRPAAPEGRDLLSRLAASSMRRGQSVDHPPDHTGLGSAVDRVDRPGGSVSLCADSASRHRAAVEDWGSHGQGCARLEARHWSDVDELNRRARELVAPCGPAVNAGGREFCPGEPVVVRRTRATLHLTRGRAGTVVAVDLERQRLRIQFSGDNKPIDVDARRMTPSVLTHGYAVLAGSRQPRGLPVYTLDVRRKAAPDGAPVHHYVVAGVAGRPAPQHDPLTRLAHAAVPSPPENAQRSLNELTATRLLLAARLRATVPAGGSNPSVLCAALEDAREEQEAARHWAAAHLPGAAARLADAQDAVLRHEQAATRFDAWIADHHPELGQLAGLDQAITARRELLGRAAELLPHRDLIAVLGPPPEGPMARRAWREAAIDHETAGDEIVGRLLDGRRIQPRAVDRRRPPEHQRTAGICLP
jgi:hypothetical protein